MYPPIRSARMLAPEPDPSKDRLVLKTPLPEASVLVEHVASIPGEMLRDPGRGLPLLDELGLLSVRSKTRGDDHRLRPYRSKLVHATEQECQILVDDRRRRIPVRIKFLERDHGVLINLT